jgi:hypothetical protein
MEEQGSARGAERQVAELVEDDEIGVGEPGGDLSWLALKLLLFESVDELDIGKKRTRLQMMLDCLDADRGGEMRLARAGAADQEGDSGQGSEIDGLSARGRPLSKLSRPFRHCGRPPGTRSDEADAPAPR